MIWQACDENGNPLYYGGYGSFGLGEEGTLARGIRQCLIHGQYVKEIYWICGRKFGKVK